MQAIRLLEEHGVQTPDGLLRAPPAVLTRSTVNHYLRQWGFDYRTLTRAPPAVRFEARHSNDCWQFDLSPSDLKQVARPAWIEEGRGPPLLMLYSVVDDRSGAAYQEYHGVYGEDVEAALRFLFNAMAPKSDPEFPLQGRPAMLYMDSGPIGKSLIFLGTLRHLRPRARAAQGRGRGPHRARGHGLRGGPGPGRRSGDPVVGPLRHRALCGARRAPLRPLCPGRRSHPAAPLPLLQEDQDPAARRAHRHPGRAARPAGLKRLIELVQNNGGTLSVVLVGHPKLRNDLRRPALEEIGARTALFWLDGIKGQERAYLDWLLGQCTAEGAPEILTTPAIKRLAAALSTPLQIEQIPRPGAGGGPDPLRLWRPRPGGTARRRRRGERAGGER